jgi:hypothetical protein
LAAALFKIRTTRVAYALRKQTVEPVFGIIKSVMGLRQFLLRRLGSVQGEWTLVCRVCNQDARPYCACSKGKSRESHLFRQRIDHLSPWTALQRLFRSFSPTGY